MPSSRNRIVAARFADHARLYDSRARLQEEVADRLAGMLPSVARPAVLEVGCGTGFLTRRLLERYPGGDLLITDLAPEMVEQCRARYQRANGRALRFQVMDGEEPDETGRFDLIVLSMTAQWFSDPLEGLRRLAGRLKPGGMLLYSTLGPGCFPEWRAALDAGGLHHGLIDMPALPHAQFEEIRIAEYGSGFAFLASLKAIGAGTPRPGYQPLPTGSLRASLRRLERDHDARVTWSIVYGAIPAEDDASS